MRARWLRLVSQVLSALELSDAPLEAIEIIRGPVLRASERAAKRYADPGEASPSESRETRESPATSDEASASMTARA